MKFVLSFLFGAIGGAIVGSVVALLFAPSSGEELRTNIKTRADTQYARLKVEWQKGMQGMQTRMDKMSSDMQAMTSRSKETGKSA